MGTGFAARHSLSIFRTDFVTYLMRIMMKMKMMMMMITIIIIIIIIIIIREKYLKFEYLTIEIQFIWILKTKVVPVIIGATGTISKLLKK